MAYEQYSFFNSTDEDERSYGAEVFAEYFASFIGNGIFNGGDNLRTYADGTTRSVKVKPGRAWINGYYYALKEDAEGAEYVLETAPADATNDRIDAVVLRLDTAATARSMGLKVIEGEPAASPVAPAPVREGDVYDLVLAHVLVTANTATVQAAAVTDKRLVTELCGLVNSLITVDTTAMQNVFDACIAAWDDRVDDCDAEWEALLGSVQGVLDGKAPAVHGHEIADVNGLSTALDGKAPSSHNQAAGTITAGTLAGRVQAQAAAVGTLGNKQVRNIIIATSAPTSGVGNGDIWLSYS